MRINLSNDRATLILTFQYSPAVVSQVKEMGVPRVWDAKRKRWLSPAAHADVSVPYLLRLGFTASLDVIRAQKYVEEKKLWLRWAKDHPEGYKGSLPLYEFQKVGALFLGYNPASLLGDEPGLGKTLQTIAALKDNSRILILCPASLKYNWHEEIKKWRPNPSCDPIVIDGNQKSRLLDWKASTALKYTIANYELLLRDWDAIKAVQWDAIVCDEAQRMANPEAKTTKAVKILSKYHPNAKRIALTGTPISNKAEDIWSIVDWLSPDFLGNYWQFKYEYCVFGTKEDEQGNEVDDYSRVVGYKDLDKLCALLEPIMLRRRKEEVLTDFPAKTVQNVKFDLSEEEGKIYDRIRRLVVDEIREYLDGIDTRSLALLPVKMLRLKQVTDHPALIGEAFQGDSSKLKVLKELLEPVIANGDKAIIFTQFAEMAKILNRAFIDLDPLLISGSVPTEDRQRYVNAFNSDPVHKIIIMTEAGSAGLNLQAASYVFHYDAPWSIAKLEQREGRAHRIGQTKPVTVYNLIARGTIDEYVLKVLKTKNLLSLEVLGDEERLEKAGLSEEDIKSILRM